MGELRRFIQVPWPLGMLRHHLQSTDPDLLHDLTTLGSPCYGMVDGHHNTWIVYHNKVLRCFTRIFETLRLYPCSLELKQLFFLQAMLSSIIDRVHGSPHVRNVPSLEGLGQSFLSDFAEFEGAEVNGFIARQALVMTASEFVFGVRGLVPPVSPGKKLDFLSQMLADIEHKTQHENPDFHSFEVFHGMLRESLSADSFSDLKVPLVAELSEFLKNPGSKAKASRKGRIIRASLKSKPGVSDTAERLLARLKSQNLPTIEMQKSAQVGGSEVDMSPLSETLTELGTLASSDDAQLDGVEIPRNIGPYIVLRELGQGAMGQVLLARSPSGSKVAIKLLKQNSRQDLPSLWRFGRELDLSLQLKHPCIVQGLDYGLFEGCAYLVLEFLTGGSLNESLQRRRRLEVPEVLQVLKSLAAALDYAWNQPKKYVHRDIKPANIMFDGQMHAKLADFGLAAGVSSDATRFTRTGTILGTPHYMAPEQFEGEGKEDARTDLWALGVVGVQCLVGQLPFTGSSVLKLFQAIKNQEPKHWEVLESRCPPELVEALRRCLEKDPEARFQSPAEFLQALEQLQFSCVEGLPVTPLPKRVCLQFRKPDEELSQSLFVFLGEGLRYGRNSSEPLDLCLRLLPSSQYREHSARLSGEHGAFLFENGQLVVQDRSSNGSSLNGQKLKRGQSVVLDSSDLLVLADVLTLRLHAYPGALSIRRAENWPQHSYLWLRESFALSAGSALTGTLMRSGEGVQWLCSEPCQVNGRSIKNGEAFGLAVGQKIETQELSVQVLDVEWDMFKLRSGKKSSRKQTSSESF